MPLTKSHQKTKAQHLYFTTALTQKHIAQAVRVTEKTLGTWIKKENWAAQKSATYYSPDQELHQLYEQLGKLNERIANRKDTEGIVTKEDLDIKTKLVALITILQKNGSNWRNIAAEYDFHNPNIIDLSALSALERKNLEKRQAAAEEDARLGPGERFSAETMDDYYSRVAKISFAADSCASKVGKDGKPLAEDDPQRLKWEEMMRQGKGPFRGRREDEDRGDESGKESESGDGTESTKENGSGDGTGSGDKKNGTGRRSEDGRSNDDLPPGWTWMDMPEGDDE